AWLVQRWAWRPAGAEMTVSLEEYRLIHKKRTQSD
ncbi:MAG TPA: virulence factor BrkB family protein, partial [Candidatus Handelsmanbacteria bacterium]|nr:virulence factor BrkB family protein [Candidatus Handelsmanbacteria bacterium]